MTADNNITVPASVYAEAKAWIASQEAFEAEHKTPAPLTSAQRKALEALRLPIGDVNYVGMLIEHRQKHPDGGDLVWVEEASGVLAGGTIGRVCRVTITESLAHTSGRIEAFPAEGYGLLPETGKAPIFPTKKAAKRFAAKCAVDWLVAQRFLPPYQDAQGVAVSEPVSIPEDVVSPPTGGASLKRPSEGTNNTPSPPPKRSSTTAATTTTSNTVFQKRTSNPTIDTASSKAGEDDATLSAPELVANLCKYLGFPAPRYHCEQSSLGVFDGYPEFQDYGDKELLSLKEDGAVKGVVGRGNARQAMAAKLLKPLRTIRAEREAQVKLALGEA